MIVADFLADIQFLPDPRILLFEDVPSILDRVQLGEQFVFVGCGFPDQPEGTASGSEPLRLTNKGSKHQLRLAADYTSITAMMAADSSRVLQKWPFRYRASEPEGAGLSMRELVEKLTIVAEDAAPDSILGFLMLLAACQGISLPCFFPAWRDAVDDWERHGNAEQPMHSWCALESALVHRRFPIQMSLTADLMSKAWGEGLRFLAASLTRDLHPECLPQVPICAEHSMAMYALQQEQQAYEQWLQHAQIVQLSLPLASTTDRKLLVDAILVDENQTTGSARTFYRNDKINSPLNKGFALAVHHRPHSSEAYPDITIAVDPRRGVRLSDLHKALENAETVAWAKHREARSTRPPRYMENVPNTYEQPWYMDRDHTLIASPRRVSDQRNGSFLNRDAVLDLIWETYHPLTGIKVLPSPTAFEPVSLLEVRPVSPTHSSAGKCLLAASWLNGEETSLPLALPNAPTIWRMLAAMTRSRGNGGLPPLKTLPSAGDYDHVELAGGLAIVTDDGAFVLDDWTPNTIDWNKLLEVFNAATELLDRVQLFEASIATLIEELNLHLDSALRLNDVQRLLRRTSTLSTQLAQVQGKYALPSPHANARILSQALSRRWALDSRLNALSAEVLSLQTALRTSLEIGTASITRLIATFGFAAGIAAALASPTAKWLAPYFTGQPRTQEAPGSFVVILFLILTSVAWLIVDQRFRRTDLLRKNRG
jgi:hypothetical protein